MICLNILRSLIPNDLFMLCKIGIISNVLSEVKGTKTNYWR